MGLVSDQRLMNTQLNDSLSQQWFTRFKYICVPLLEKSQLSAGTVATVLALLSNLEDTLLDANGTGFTLSQSLVSYIFFPLSTILRRNESSAIPDQILEKIFGVLAILCETWWWYCDIQIWDQIFKLSSSIIGGVEGKGKGKVRDDETKDAAARCLWAILRERRAEEAPKESPEELLHTRVSQLQAHSQSLQFIPILGQTINTLLLTAKSPYLPLQRISLKILRALHDQNRPRDVEQEGMGQWRHRCSEPWDPGARNCEVVRRRCIHPRGYRSECRGP